MIDSSIGWSMCPFTGLRVLFESIRIESALCHRRGVVMRCLCVTCAQLSHRGTGAIDIATSVLRSVQCTWLMFIDPPNATAYLNQGDTNLVLPFLSSGLVYVSTPCSRCIATRFRGLAWRQSPAATRGGTLR